MRQWTARHRLAASGNGGVGGNDSSSALLSILPGGATTSQIANPAGLTDARGNALAFSRAQAAYCRKSLTFDATNLCPNPEQISLWNQDNTGVSAPAVTANYDLAPDGTKSATRIQFNAVPNVGNDSQLFVSPTITAGTYTFSCYIKSTDGVSTGTTYVMLQGVGLTTAANFTGQWQRFSVTAAQGTGATNVKIGCDRTGGQSTPAMLACDILVWGAKLELAASPTTYVSPMLVSIPANTARVEPEGLLLESGSTNVILQSQTLATSPWVGNGNATCVNATTIAPDGTLTGSSITITAGTAGTMSWSQNITQAASTTFTFSIYLWAASAGFQLRLARTNTAAWGTATVSSTITLTTTPTKYTLTYTTGGADTASGLVIGSENKTPFTSSTGTFFAWGAQLEQLPYCTSYIPTTAASVSRGVDLITYGTCGSGALTPLTLTNGRFAMTLNPFGWSSAGNTQVPGGSTQVTLSSSVLYMNTGDLNFYSYNGSTAVNLDAQAHDGVPRKYQITWTSGSRTIDDFTDGTSATSPTPFTVSFAGQTITSSGFEAHLTDIAFYRS